MASISPPVTMGLRNYGPGHKVYVEKLEEVLIGTLAEWGILGCRHALFIFTDEIYVYFVYDNLWHGSLALLPDYGKPHNHHLWVFQNV